MKANEGRLQTAEHILVRSIESRFQDAKFIIARAEENFGLIEISTKTDLRKISKVALQDGVNAVIKKNLQGSKHVMRKEDAEKEFDLSRSINRSKRGELEISKLAWRLLLFPRIDCLCLVAYSHPSIV